MPLIFGNSQVCPGLICTVQGTHCLGFLVGATIEALISTYTILAPNLQPVLCRNRHCSIRTFHSR